MRNRSKYSKIITTKEGRPYFKPLKYPDIPYSVNDLYIITTIGDRLDSLANQFYNDIRLWWIIANANPGIVGRDSFSLKAGLEVRIPSNYRYILERFEKINK